MTKRTRYLKLMGLIVIFLLALNVATPALSRPIAQRNTAPFYSQRDELWSGELLGTSAELTIGSHGCGVSAAAMLLNAYDLLYPPPTLNTALKENGGFSGALLNWGKAAAWSKATGSQIQAVSRYTSYDEDVLIKNLEHGRPVIVYLNGQHYVLVTGFEEVDDPDKPGQKKKQFYINDPWAETAENGQDIPIEDNQLVPKYTITQMIVLHTDPALPVDGPLVDWPAIQAKYSSLGGMDGVLGKPTADDTASQSSLGYVDIRQQPFEGGAIFAYKFGGVSDWQAYWLPKTLSADYNQKEHGLITYDTYTSTLNGMIYEDRVDAENASLLYSPFDQRVEILTRENGIPAEYFNNTDLSGEPIVKRFENDINFDWRSGPPHPALTERYSLRLTQSLKTSVPFFYTFTIPANGGMRSFLDGEVLVDQWEKDEGSSAVTRWLMPGNHEWVIEFRNTSDYPLLAAAMTTFPVKPVWAEEEASGSTDVLPLAAPGSETAPPSEPPTVIPPVDNDLLKSLEDTLNNLLSDLQVKAEMAFSQLIQKIEDWFATNLVQLTRQFEAWLVEQLDQLLNQIALELNKLLQQTCLGVIPVGMIASYAFWRRRKRSKFQ